MFREWIQFGAVIVIMLAVVDILKLLKDKK